MKDQYIPVQMLMKQGIERIEWTACDLRQYASARSLYGCTDQEKAESETLIAAADVLNRIANKAREALPPQPTIAETLHGRKSDQK